MAETLEELVAERHVDRSAVDRHKKRMLEGVRAYKLRELREASDLTQVELASRLEVSQNRVSRIEHGDIERTQVDTLRDTSRRLAVGSGSRSNLGDERIQIA